MGCRDRVSDSVDRDLRGLAAAPVHAVNHSDFVGSFIKGDVKYVNSATMVVADQSWHWFLLFRSIDIVFLL